MIDHGSVSESMALCQGLLQPKLILRIKASPDQGWSQPLVKDGSSPVAIPRDGPALIQVLDQP